MALQVRRGTNAERLGITPLVGELIYVTDTKQLYVGDGTTVGGTTTIANTIDSLLADTSPQLGGELDLNGNNITGTGNINITGTITASGTVNLGDGVGSDILVIGGAIQGHLVPDADSAHNLGSPTKYWNDAWLNQLTVDSQITAERVQADIIGDDSSLIVNISTNTVTGVFSGNLTGDVTGDVSGTAGAVPFSGVTSTPTTLSGYGITDAVTSGAADAITATMVAENVITTRELANGNSYNGTFDGDLTGSVFGDNSSLLVDGNNNTIVGDVDTASVKTNSVLDGNNSGILTINLNNTTNTQPRILLESNGTSGSGLWITTNDTTRTLAGTDNIGRVLFRSIDAGGTETPAVMIARKDELIIAVGDKNTAETFHMDTATGNYGLGIEPNADAKVNVGGAMLLGNMTTTVRDALTAANGMIIYNTTDNKFQGYENGSWANLI